MCYWGLTCCQPPSQAILLLGGLAPVLSSLLLGGQACMGHSRCLPGANLPGALHAYPLLWTLTCACSGPSTLAGRQPRYWGPEHAPHHVKPMASPLHPFQCPKGSKSLVSSWHNRRAPPQPSTRLAKQCSTRGSQEIPQPSTNLAQPRLTSEF